AEYAYGLSSVSGGREPARVNIAAVSNGFFETLGVEPMRGRSLGPEELRVNGAPAAGVRYGYWQGYLGGRAGLSSLHFGAEGTVYPVIGVMPQEFDFPPGTAVWVPREFRVETVRTGHNWRGIGRVRDGLTVAQARADLSTIAHRIRDQYGNKVDLTDATVI